MMLRHGIDVTNLTTELEGVAHNIIKAMREKKDPKPVSRTLLDDSDEAGMKSEFSLSNLTTQLKECNCCYNDLEYA